MTDQQPVVAYLGIGANLGDCRQTLVWARQQLTRAGVEVVASSPLYRTAAVGGPAEQPDYLNAVLQVQTRHDPEALLACCLEIEQQAGRTRDIHWGPRTLDLDVLLYGDQCFDLAHLTVPHPRLHVRRFVLEPLCQLAPQLIHPRLNQTMITLLTQLDDNDAVDCIEEQW
ncbi:MAG: 2-amino-4-hydroxy-6-hydroxymethyldihydropteridine diphosphokinase [Desulfuromonas sp.]|nr:MAG: 2-amino-4-hydroxy-6-hydroxymethyldihydropteridine diphosphokinase [Desulfuromonas sp.]